MRRSYAPCDLVYPLLSHVGRSLAAVCLCLWIATMLTGCAQEPQQASASPDEACMAADEALRHAESIEALQVPLQQYTSLLDDDPQLACAQKGIEATLDKQESKRQEKCQQGDEYLEAKAYEAALKSYAALLEDDPWSRCARQGIATTLSEVAPLHEEKTCKAAQSILSTAESASGYREAVRAYAVDLQQDPKLECAHTGIEQAFAKLDQADPRCEKARAALDQNRYRDAVKAYAALLGEDPTLVCAQAGIEEAINSLRAYEQKFVAVRSLVEMGHMKEAQSQLQQVLQKEENAGLAAPEDLRSLLAGRIPFWIRVRQFYWGWVRPIGEIALVALIVIAAVALVFARTVPWLRSLRRLQLDIEAFKHGASGQSSGEGMEALVEQAMQQLCAGREHATARMHVIDTPSQPFEVPADLRGGSEYLKIASDLIQWALPSRVIALSGTMLRSERRGAGLTLKLVKKGTGKVIDGCTLWQQEYDPGIGSSAAPAAGSPLPADSYAFLAEPAAIWALFALSGARKRKAPLQILGTDRWKSYAYLRCGVGWRLKGERVKARQMFLEALNEDTKNRGAWFNLGVMDTEKEAYEQAIQRLEWSSDLEPYGEGASKAADPQQSPAETKDAVWYRAMYQRAAAYFYQYLTALPQAEQEAQALREKAERKAQELRRQWKGRQARAALEQARREGKKKIEQARERRQTCLTRAARDVQALDQAIQHAKAENKPDRTFLDTLEKLVQSIQAAILHCTGDTERAQEMLRELEACERDLTYRERYNLACTWSIMGSAYYERALENLKYALERGGGIVTWAQEDPSLGGVRTGAEDRFKALIEAHTAQ